MFPVLRGSRLLPLLEPVNRLEGAFDRASSPVAYAPMSVWQDSDKVYVEADVPGLLESDLEVTVHQGVLLIRGERKAEEGQNLLFNNRRFGRFERSVVLPDEVQADGVQADLANGVLRVTLPKRPEAQPKRISVQSN